MSDDMTTTDAAPTEGAEASTESTTQSLADFKRELIAKGREAQEAAEAEAPDAEPAAAPAATPAADEREDLKGCVGMLKAREQENQARQEVRRAREEAQAALAEAKAIREAAKKEAEAFAAELAEAKKNPASFFKKAGWDPDEFIVDVAKANDPERQAEKQRLEKESALARELEELKAWRKKQETDAEESKRKAQEEYEKQQAEAAKKGFLSVALNAEKHPTIAKVYGPRPHLLLIEAERVADEYYQATKRSTGKGEYATWEDIAEYLEAQHTDPGQQPSTQQPPGRREAPQAERATGTRTITPSRASERRSAPDESSEPPTRAELVALTKRIIASKQTA